MEETLLINTSLEQTMITFLSFSLFSEAAPSRAISTSLFLSVPQTLVIYYSKGAHVGFVVFSFCGKALREEDDVCSSFFTSFCPSLVSGFLPPKGPQLYYKKMFGRGLEHVLRVSWTEASIENTQGWTQS